MASAPQRSTQFFALVCACIVARAASAQQLITPRADLQFASTHIWRGFNRTSGSVMQTDIAAGLRLGPKLQLSAGAWLNVDFAEGGRGRVSDLEPRRWGFTEVDGWIRLGAAVGTTRFSVAGIRYHPTRQTAPDVTEVVGDVFIQARRWVPRLMVAHRLEHGGGTYIEPSIAFLHFVSPFDGTGFSLISRIEAGGQLGRDLIAATGTGTIPAADNTGLTHVALSSDLRLSVYFGAANVFFSVGARLQYSADAAVRVLSGNHYGDHSPMHLWVPMAVGITLPMRRDTW